MSQQPPTTRILDLRWAHEVVSRPVEWLWQPWLARGTIAVLDGDRGVGKSSLAFDLAARISAGRPFPGETEPRAPEVALVVAMEDPLDTVVKPRLENAGADMTRVALLGGVRESGPHGETESVLQLPRDLDLIADACALYRPALMVIGVGERAEELQRRPREDARPDREFRAEVAQRPAQVEVPRRTSASRTVEGRARGCKRFRRPPLPGASFARTYMGGARSF